MMVFSSRKEQCVLQMSGTMSRSIFPDPKESDCLFRCLNREQAVYVRSVFSPRDSPRRPLTRVREPMRMISIPTASLMQMAR